MIMNAPEQAPTAADIEQQMIATLTRQREDYLQEGVVTAETRIDRLQRGADVLIKYNAKLIPKTIAIEARAKHYISSPKAIPIKLATA